MKKDITNHDTQNMVSIGGGPSPELTNRVIERAALLLLPEIHKRDATPENPFTINDELNYWEEHQVIFIGRNEQELIEICKVKIKGLERKLIDQKEAIPKPYKRSIKAEETIDQNTDNAEILHEAIQEFKAAKEQLLKESQERVVVNKPRILIRKPKPNTFKELLINPDHAELDNVELPKTIDLERFNTWFIDALDNFSMEMDYLDNSPEKIDAFIFPNGFTNKQKILIIRYVFKYGNQARQTDKLVRCRYNAWKVGHILPGKVQNSGFFETFDKVIAFKPTAQLRNDLIKVLELIESCKVPEVVLKMIKADIQVIKDGILAEKKDLIERNNK